MTECITQSPLSDDDLIAALDGEAGEQILHHLQICAYCSERLEQMRRFEEGMQTIMYRVDCPPSDALADYVMGISTFDSHQYVENHLQTCVLCRKEVQTLQMVLVPDEQVLEQAAPPEPIWQRVKSWAQNIEDQLITVLIPTPLSPAQALKAKRRSDRERILNHQHESVTVMLRLEKDIDGLKIAGTILNEEDIGGWANGYAELTSQSHARFLAAIDEGESFTFERIKPGLFQLSIYAADSHILRLNDIDLTL